MKEKEFQGPARFFRGTPGEYSDGFLKEFFIILRDKMLRELLKEASSEIRRRISEVFSEETSEGSHEEIQIETLRGTSETKSS